MTWLAGCNLLIMVLGFAWIGGRKEQRGRDNSSRLREHDKWLDEHRVRLDGHDVELAKINAWREGYNAGARKRAEGE